MEDRYVKPDDNKKQIYTVATNIYGHSTIQPLLFDELEMWLGDPELYMKKLVEILNTPDDSDIGYFLEVDSRYPDNIKEKTKNFPFCPENKKINPKNIIMVICIR